MTTAAVATATSPLWFATRATGLTALVLLTVTVVLGVLTSVRFASPAWPRFVTVALHRNLSLLAATFTGLHVLTTVTDPYASISVVSVAVPFSSPYRRIWLGLGAVAWLRAGPLSPGWARRAGTPATLLAHSAGAGGASSVRSGQSAFPTAPFQMSVTGTVANQPGPASGERTVTIDAASGTTARLRIVISGPAVTGGVEMTASQVALGPPAAPTRYTGRVVSLNGAAMQATVSGAGQRLSLAIQLAQSGTSVTGTLAAVPGQGGE
jgi:hypothetical protein